MPPPTVASTRARWGLAFVVGSFVFAVGLLFNGFYQRFPEAGPVTHAVLTAAGIVLTGVAVLMFGVGMVALVTALSLAASRVGRATLIAALVGLILLALCAVLFLFLPFLGLGLLVVGATIGAAVVVAAGPPFVITAKVGRATRKRAALACGLALVNLVLIALGAAHLLLWNPLAKVPGLTIDEIYSEMAQRGEGTGVDMIVAWAAFWALASIALAVLGSLARTASLLTFRRVVVLGLLLCGMTIFFQWWAGFAIGMSLADAFSTSGGDSAPSGPILSIIGQLSIVAAVFVALVPPRTEEQDVSASMPVPDGISS
jgi:hypothetical protein